MSQDATPELEPDFPPRPELVEQIANDVHDELGNWGVSQLGTGPTSGLPDAIWKVWDPFQTLTPEQQEIVVGLVDSELFGR